MFPDLDAQLGIKLVAATIVVAFALIVFFLVTRAWRNRGVRSSRHGGIRRGPRLAVLDTAAVDARRRLVLIRRDSVEHLLLIGGPSDVVIESRIAETGRTSLGDGAVPPAAEQKIAATGHRMAEHPAPAPAPAGGTGRAVDAGKKDIPAPMPAAASGAAATALAAGSHPAAVRESAPLAAERAQADAASILDDHRARVLGPAAQPATPQQDSPYVRAYAGETEAAPVATPAREQAASVLRFDDFLDAEITGDLSKVTPSGSEPPSATQPAPQPRPDGASVPQRPDSALDDEMTRLLGEISPKR